MDSMLKYLDYQKYLYDLMNYKKSELSFYSYRYIGRKIGLDPGFFAKITHGKKHLPEYYIDALGSLFGWSNKETNYFSFMLKYGKANSNKEIKKYFEELMYLRGSEVSIVNDYQYEFYQKWYHSAIHALLYIYPFYDGDSYRELAQSLAPEIKAIEARESIRLLLRIGLVKKSGNGRIYPTDGFISTTEKWHSSAIEDFQKRCIEISADAISRFPRNEREISSLTIAVSHKDIDTIREIINECKNSIIRLETGNAPADRVYQINFQAYPLSNILKKGDNR